MSEELSESSIIKALAEQTARRITGKVVADLQRMKHTLSGDDSGLKTTWDEICVQVQEEDSFQWNSYDDTVRAIVRSYVTQLPQHERDALWLQTDQGSDWDCQDENEREANPVCDDHIIDYLTQEYIYAEAGQWSNSRIRAFIERSSMRD
jgi:hypothetical protein